MIGKILLVDDDLAVSAALSALLEDMDWEVCSVENAARAYTVFVEFSPDVVLLDVDLPDASGMEVLRQIKDRDGSMPVIMISGVETPERVAEGLRNGAQRFVQKPFTSDVLAEALREARQPARS